MGSSPHIVVVGSHAPGLLIRVKRVPARGETVIGWGFEEPIDGGKGSNQAIAAARLGAQVGFVGCVGRDRIGENGTAWLREAGVDIRYLRHSETTASAVGFILLEPDGTPAMVTSMGANDDLQTQDVDAALASMSDARVLLTQLEIPIEVARHAVRAAQQRGMTAILNAAPAPEQPITGLGAATLLVVNETEALTLLGEPPTGEAAIAAMTNTLRDRSGAGCVIITLGEHGMVGADADGVWEVGPPAVQAVDTSGAGDAFCAALAVALDRDRPVRLAARWACAVAALSVTRPGTIPAFPTASEVDAFVARHGSW